MNCPKCGQEIVGLACPACTALNSRDAVIQMQPSYLADVRRGALLFYAKRLSQRHPWHLMLFGDRAHGLCGIEIAQAGKNNRREVPYSDLARLEAGKALCAACRNALHAIEEAEAIREES